jgi:hypothetical protein
MRKRFMTLAAAFVRLAPAPLLVLLCAEFASAACMPIPKGEFDARDFSGIWFRQGGDCGFGPDGSAPPLTPAGEEAIKKNIPTRPRHPLQKKVDDPSQSNDPALTCNPKGFPQIVVDTAHDHHEVIQQPGRIIQWWQEERVPREIWMDGRPVPSGDNLANLGVSFYGMSVGHWEGDTLVVETVGLEPTAWVDIFGYPKSENARVIERYTKVNATTLQVQLTLFDPAYYKAPWVSDIKTFKKEARDGPQVNHFGWYGLFSSLTDLLCAPKFNTGPTGKY